MRKLFVSALLTLSVTSMSYGAADDIPSGGGNTDARGGYPVLQVFDSRGKSVGPVFSTDLLTGVILNVSGANVLVPIQRVSNSAGHYSASQYQWAQSSNVQFVTSNCSPPPMVNTNSSALRPVIVIRSGADATAYIAPDTSTSMATVGSYLNGTQCITTGVSGVQAFSEPTWGVGSIYPLTQNYPEPLTIHY